MSEHAELINRLELLIGDDAREDNIFRQASDAIRRLSAQHAGCSTDSALLEEPTDHEAEGAMRYVMSRGKM